MRYGACMRKHTAAIQCRDAQQKRLTGREMESEVIVATKVNRGLQRVRDVLGTARDHKEGAIRDVEDT